jgi:CheY-like chemotaxis protein
MNRLLVVDDERVVRELMVEVLVRAGHSVVACDRPGAALELLAGDSFDLLVTDLAMPGLSGLELLERVRALRPGLPVIVASGAGAEHELRTAVELGATAALAKPFTHAQLRDAVAAALGHS